MLRVSHLWRACRMQETAWEEWIGCQIPNLKSFTSETRFSPSNSIPQNLILIDWQCMRSAMTQIDYQHTIWSLARSGSVLLISSSMLITSKSRSLLSFQFPSVSPFFKLRHMCCWVGFRFSYWFWIRRGWTCEDSRVGDELRS